jgi:hypothetical protein
MITHKWLIAVGSSVLLAAAIAIGSPLGSGSARARPHADAAAVAQTIDAKTDPAAAGKALNDFCQIIANCQFVGTAPVTVDYDAPRVLGDALYNCGGSDAEDEVTLSDERSESTSVDESLTAKVQLGFLGLAKSSIEAEIKSGQLDEVATKTTQTHSVTVAPGEVGYTTTRVPTAYLSGDAHITDGVNLIKVTNLELTYPGYGNAALTALTFASNHAGISDYARVHYCDTLPALSSVAAVGAAAADDVDLMVCPDRLTPTVRGADREPADRHCASRELTLGEPLSIPAGTEVTLARGGVVYAEGRTPATELVLHARRALPLGSYTVALSGPRDDTMLQAQLR